MRPDPAWALPVWAAVVVAKAVALVVAATRLPEQVASHFGASGAADSVMSRPGFLAVDALVAAGLLLGLPALGWLLVRGGGAGLNVPDKEWWLRPENRPVLQRKVVGDMLVVAALTGALLVWLDVAVVQANQQAVPSLGPSATVVVVAFGVAVVGWAVFVVPRRYRAPGRSDRD